MAQGTSHWNAVAGGGQQRANASQLARWLVQLGVCTGAAPNQLLQPGDQSSLLLQTGSGPLAEAMAFRQRGGQPCYGMAINPSQPGYAGAVTQVGAGTGAIAVSLAPHIPILVKCIVGGALGTATFRFSLDAGVTWSAIIASTVTSWAYLVPGTFCTLTFGAATYVATKTLAVGTDGTVTPGSAWVGTVTQASSPVDYFEVYAAVVTGGALGTAVLSISVDGGPIGAGQGTNGQPLGGGNSFLPNMLVPSAGVLVLAGTGLVLTCSSTFTLGDYYQFLAAPPSYTTGDLNAALTALAAIKNVQWTAVHSVGLPASAAAAVTQQAAIESAMQSAFANTNLDWQAMCECPCAPTGGVGDIVVSGSAAIRDTADTDAVILAARGSDSLRTAVHVGTYRITSAITKRNHLRPLGWLAADRYCITDPSQDLSAPAPFGPLRSFIPPGALSIGRDETSTPALDNIQFNTARTLPGAQAGIYLGITSGGSGWKNCTTQVSWQDAGFVRILNVAIATLRPTGLQLLAQRPQVNADGTIAESIARAWSTMLDNAFKRAVGLLPGGAYKISNPQASSATATVNRGSQLGATPKQLVIDYNLESLGFVSDVANNMFFSGTLTLTA